MCILEQYLIRTVHILPLDLPLKRPFVTALGRKTISHNLLLCIELKSGKKGYGEASESLALKRQTQKRMLIVLKDLARYIQGQDIREYRNLIQEAWKLYPNDPSAVSALECALVDAFTRTLNIPLYKFWGGSQTDIETSLTISVGSPSETQAAAKEAVANGFRILKVKISRNFKENLARIEAVSAVCSKARILLDANQALNPVSALKLLSELKTRALPVEIIEQPVKSNDLSGMALITQKSPVPVIADESVRSLRNAKEIVVKRACHGINLKLAKCGLITTLEIAPLATKAKLKLMIGCMAESKIGLATSVHLACGLGAFTWIDLDSDVLLKPFRSLACSGGYQRQGPWISVKGIKAGTGIQCNL